MPIDINNIEDVFNAIEGLFFTPSEAEFLISAIRRRTVADKQVDEWKDYTGHYLDEPGAVNPHKE